LIIEVLEIFFLFLTALMLAYLVRHYIFTVTVLRHANKPKQPESPQTSSYEPTVTILVPARNEEKVIGRLLQRITELTYPKNKLQIIVINDASSDKTGKIAERYVQNNPFIEVMHRDKFSGGKGKAAAMNHGFSKSKGEIVLCFDADYYPQRDIVEKLVSVFVDPEVGGVQGRVVVLNEPQNTVTRLVALERVGGYRVDQEARNKLGLITQFGGTVGGFRRSVLESLHGWDETTLAEDTDLTFRIYLAGYIVRYNVDAECYEEAVDTWKAYSRQRYRWTKGHMQCFFKHFWQVLTTKNLNMLQKIDGLLLLNVYFMPLLVLISAIIGLVLISSGIGLINVTDLSIRQYVASAFWFSFPISCYSFVGNFAPFFEVGVGLYLDGRKRSQWLIPLSILTFIYNVPICLVALFDVVISKIKGKNSHVWVKTTHTGNGNHYIENQGISQERALWA
jgi:cellulose synthase/poly-beta-1,6-N-acetylglucosamine synthase-like glycosyltransferase